MAISDVWVGATAPEGGAEVETLVIKDGKYDTAFGVVIIECELDGADLKTKKTAGEILDLVNEGAILFGRLEANENDVVIFPVLECALSSGTYTLTALAQSGSVMTGTATDADDPIVVSSN